VFSTSLYKINYLLKKEIIDKEDDLQVLENLLEQYRDLINVFLKAASNSLPPRRLYNHKIQLIDSTIDNLSFTPLRH
jgi:hypothetical protein